MKLNGKIEVVNVANIEFIDIGRSMRLEIIDSIPPHATRFITFRNTCGVTLFKSGEDEFPMDVIDITWREIPQNERIKELLRHRYPIFDSSECPAAAKRPLIVAHLEGTIVGDILAEEITIESM